jgi:choline transport protein
MATIREKESAFSGDVPVSHDDDSGWGQDEKDMARMGKKQEFKRNFGWISSVGFTSCTMGT